MTDKDHNTLTQQLKSGSYKAFHVLYNQYFDLLYGFVFDLTRSHEKTSELVQETFIKVWINRHQVDPDQSFKAWLYKIAKNLLLDAIRKQWNDPLFVEYMNCSSYENLSISSVKENFDFDMFCKLLEKAKRKLSPRQREVFELNKEQDYSASEIASLLQISEQAVYNYLSQAKAILYKEMKPFKSAFLLFF